MAPTIDFTTPSAVASRPDTAARAWLRRWWPYLLSTGIVLFLRWPTVSDRIYSIDEPGYFAQAARLRSLDAFIYAFYYRTETKSQISLIPYLLASSISHEHAVLLVHAFGLLTVLVSCYLLISLGRRFLGSVLPGLAAALIWVPFLEVGPGYAIGGHTTLEFYPTPKLEYFQMPFILATLYLFALGASTHQERRAASRLYLIGAGASWALTILIKPSALLLGPFFLLLLIYLAPRPLIQGTILANILTQAGAFTLGAAVPLAAVFGPYLFNPPALAELRFNLTDVASAYGGASASDPIIRFSALLVSGMPPLLLVAFLVLPFLVRRRIPQQIPREMAVVLALVAATGPLVLLNSLPGCTCPYYLVTVVPFLALTATAYLDLGLRGLHDAHGRRRRAIGFALLIIIMLVPQIPELLRFPATATVDSYRQADQQAFDLAGLLAYIQTHSQEDAPIWVYYNAPELYLWSNRLPATRDPQGFWLASIATELWFQRNADELAIDRPELIVGLDHPPLAHPTAPRFDQLPHISSWVAENYDCQAQTIRGAVICTRR